MSFSTREPNIWPQAISFVPIIERSFDLDSPTDTGLKSIALVSEGQLRKFRYRYPNASSSKSLALVPTDLKQHPDAIALALPKDSQELAVKRGQLSVPSPLAQDEPVFPAVSPNPSIQFLEVNYQVPPTDFQRSVVKWGVKLLAAFLPIAGLFFLREDQIRNNRLRWSLIIGGTTVFVVVFGLIIWAAYNSNNREDVVGELVLLLGSGAISAGMFFSKTDKPGAPVAPTG
ncbi:hypothetical protein [Bradyrhizobium sp.]|uniref:hypothetical protein n=1 Tax=Bradyrhizobium sp. TaxID=376 RepID=UPI002DDD9B62|nr:hypothetical protein [Bradyrhizobium sp.]HEV2156360.1 hypothetical protein [Bradyrhizobium sp.]